MALARNITLDDFDAVFTYYNDTTFNTNDPSRNSPAYAIFHDGTVHYTDTPTAYINLTFKGTDIYLYGAAGPAYGAYSVELDGQASSAMTAFAEQNATLPHLLYTASNLSIDQEHVLLLKNDGRNGTGQDSRMLFDYAEMTVPLAPEGATLVNTTVENDNSSLIYTGHWDSNSDSHFSGGTTSYTNQTGASVSLSFIGSAIYVFGDANNDHYAFNVTLDGVTTSHRTPLGCGGQFEPHACEKIQPGLQYFAGPLNNSQHTITVTNWVVPTLNYSFFDLDRFVYTTPSAYIELPSSNSSIGSSNSNKNDGATGRGVRVSFAGSALTTMTLASLLYLVITSMTIF